MEHQSLWNEEEAAQCRGELALRVYSARLLGRDRSLVLYGGGNASVKIEEKNLFGEEQTLLYVKGSGWDMETIEAQGFAPLDQQRLLKLLTLPSLSDEHMLNELQTGVVTVGAPRASVETLLHALVPARFVDHTHADAIIALCDSPTGEAVLQELYGEDCLIVPYRMPGFELARHCAELLQKKKHSKTAGLVLLNHGIVSFGESARESYERMIALVTRAERYLSRRRAWEVVLEAGAPAVADALSQSKLRRAVSDVAGAPMILKTCTTPRTVGFARHPAAAELLEQGPVTPDHVSRTKRLALYGLDVEAYAAQYRRYFEEHAPRLRQPKVMFDPAPRVIVDASFGLASAGKSAREAGIVEEIFHHAMDTMLRAHALGGFRTLGAKEIFDVEYWDLQQAKHQAKRSPPPFSGEVALVTGAASGIGKAAVESFLARGAAVAGLDLNPAVETLHVRPDFLGIHCDVTDERALEAAIANTVLRFGGIDMLVLNAGIFSATRRIADIPTDEWRRVMTVNLDANLFLMRAAHPYLKLAVRGGRIAVIGSKNVPAPGPGASAYSASKAALNQLARVAALEWGADGIRINSLHPNAVFDTGLWTEEVLAQRAKHYGMSVDQYKANNVLHTEVTSHDVAELAAELCGPLFAKTTGAQVPVDGGNERVI